MFYRCDNNLMLILSCSLRKYHHLSLYFAILKLLETRIVCVIPFAEEVLSVVPKLLLFIFGVPPNAAFNSHAPFWNLLNL